MICDIAPVNIPGSGGGTSTIVPGAITSNFDAIAVTDHVVAKPAGTVAGDVLVAFFQTCNLVYTTPVPPPAYPWTLAQYVWGAGAAHSVWIFVRVCGGAEPAGYTFQTQSGNNPPPIGTPKAIKSSWACRRYSGVDNANPFAVAGGLPTIPPPLPGWGGGQTFGNYNAVGGATNITLAGLNLLVPNAMEVAMVTNDWGTNTTLTAGSGLTEMIEVPSRAFAWNTEIETDDGIIAAAGVAPVINWTIGGTYYISAVSTALRPATTPAGLSQGIIDWSFARDIVSVL